VILVIFALAFAVMIYGVAVLGWWMAEISAVRFRANTKETSVQPKSKKSVKRMLRNRIEITQMCVRGAEETAQRFDST